ncbi:MAG: dockerin type I domain-containing protein [Planctomycetota bacterium]|jgi:probable HAF family extracellular repeat protein
MILLSAASAQGPPQYEVAIIQAPECPIFGFPPTLGFGLNELGDVVGYHWQCGIDNWGRYDAFVWTETSGLVTLGRLPGFREASALDLNVQAQIVGYLREEGTFLRFAALWQEGEIIELGTLPGGNWSEALAINNKAQVVGSWGNTITGDPASSVFLWEDGEMTDLGPLLGTSRSGAFDINDAGKVTGWMGYSPFIDAHAFILDNGVVTDLGPIPGGSTSQGKGINDLGDVVGDGVVPDPDWPVVVWRPFLWRDGQMTDLGTLPGERRCLANDVNNARQVVGWCDHYPEDSGKTGFIWQDGVMTELDDLVPPELGIHISYVWAINEAGQISGGAGHPTFGSVAILLTPIGGPLGDLNGDGIVGVADLLLLLAAWGPCPDPPDDCPADLNGDGTVNIADLLILLANWGPHP